MKQKEIVLVVALVAIAASAWSLRSAFDRPGAGAIAVSAAPAAGPVALAVSEARLRADRGAALVAPLAPLYDGRRLARDPFRTLAEDGRPVAPPPQPAPLRVAAHAPVNRPAAVPASGRLEATVIPASGGGTAVVAGRALQVGDQLPAGRVVAVEVDHLVVETPAGARLQIPFDDKATHQAVWVVAR